MEGSKDGKNLVDPYVLPVHNRRGIAVKDNGESESVTLI